MQQQNNQQQIWPQNWNQQQNVQIQKKQVNVRSKISQIPKQKNLNSQVRSSSEDISKVCSINTFGFGGDHDANFLKKISETSNGLYFYVENVKTITDAFVDCIGGLLSTVAKNLEINIQSENKISIEKIHTTYKTITKKMVLNIQLNYLIYKVKKNVIFYLLLNYQS